MQNLKIEICASIKSIKSNYYLENQVKRLDFTKVLSLCPGEGRNFLKSEEEKQKEYWEKGLLVGTNNKSY